MTYAEQVAAIAAQIETVLKNGYDATKYAAGLIEENDNDDGYFEVRGLHTKTGNPHAFTI